jgi:hypothetical protein
MIAIPSKGIRDRDEGRARKKPQGETRRRLQRIGAAALVLATLILSLPTAAFAQETEPTQPADPLIKGSDLLILLIVVVAAAMILLGFMVYAAVVRKSSGSGEEYLPLIQGMVLVTVVVAVILLGISGKITAEGLATILAAVVGFAVGQAATSMTTTPTTTTPRATGAPATGTSDREDTT